MCERCREWHGRALALLAEGTLPPGCQECPLTFGQLNDLAAGPTVRMYVVVKDGMYQVLCAHCKDAYCALRTDLYTASPPKGSHNQ